MKDLMQLVLRKSYFWPKNNPHTNMFFGKKYVFLISAAPNLA
jgi:hypothetical protein